MSDFVMEVEGPPGLFAVFSQDEGAGYFFSYEPEGRKVLAQVCVYVSSQDLSLREGDIRILWSDDRTKCGVAVLGGMRAIINVKSERELCAPLDNRRSRGITDAAWLEGFGEYVDTQQFIRTRQRYWKEMAKEFDGFQALAENETPIETNFILYGRGPNRTFAVFEDDGKCGCLYLYSLAEQTVLRHLHLYDRSAKLQVNPEDVQVIWAAGQTKCGVVIWGKMRGIIDVAGDTEGRVWMESRETPGIGDRKWLDGFYLEDQRTD